MHVSSCNLNQKSRHDRQKREHSTSLWQILGETSMFSANVLDQFQQMCYATLLKQLSAELYVAACLPLVIANWKTVYSLIISPYFTLNI